MTDQERWRGLVECVARAFTDTTFHKDLEGLMRKVKQLEHTVYDVNPPPKPTETGKCVWRPAYIQNCNLTSCGHTMKFDWSKMINGKFCPHCGKEIA